MISIFFDTSVLISAMVTSHPANNRTFPYFERVFLGKEKGIISTHCIAEFYSVLSVLPIKPKLSPMEVEKLIQNNIIPKFEIVTLTPKDYLNAIKRVSELHLSGGILFDSLHMEAALKSKADRIVTLNQKHFEKLAQGKMKILGV